MSQETMEWLNRNVLVGFTEKRGNAWHYREGTDNHYPGAIPVGDVQRRLFDFEPVTVDRPCPCNCGEVARDVLASDTNHRFGTFTDGYQPHPYSEWLLGAVSNILGDTLAIGSAGLLKQRAEAWVQVEVPETLTVEGIAYRPNLLATTSLDGSIATTYKRTITVVVCDNTRTSALAESANGGVFRVKHTRNSTLRLSEAKDALNLISQTADAFESEVKALLGTTVTEKQWKGFLDAYVPLPEEESRKRTFGETKRGELERLYRYDNRAAPWAGTAYGVLAATNTYQHHYKIVRGADHRAERNMEAAIKGEVDKADSEALTALHNVLAAA